MQTDLTIDVKLESKDSRAWVVIYDKLDTTEAPYVRFRASTAEKEIIAKQIISYFKGWINDEDRTDIKP